MSMRDNRFGRLWLKGRKHYLAGHMKRARTCERLIRLLLNCDVPVSADIDESVHFCHNAFGCVVNPRSIIGSGCHLQHAITIGELDENGAMPVLGRNVFVGTRAVLLGGISIGDNARIGAGAVVLCDVPANATAVGVPAKVLN